MEYLGPGSQNLNTNSSNCLALFLGLFDCVLSNVEKNGWNGFFYTSQSYTANAWVYLT